MKSSILKENKDFRRVYYRGKSEASPCLVTYVMKNGQRETRVGITSGKKIGGAVQRNRARRIIRAAYAQLGGSFNANYDIVFVARTRTTQVKMQQVYQEMESHFKSLGVLK
ncbi:MAG: ribonuclease P protein component [Eubacterium sp.]|nr:ribonuclease P protein component [Eubacterium sp.]